MSKYNYKKDIIIPDTAGKDLQETAKNRHNPFFNGGRSDPDAYLEFVCEYNAFINHRPGKFKKIIDREMRL